ncbi:MAG: GNAT family N-acetyltransferase [Flavobacteriales bacterium]|nr:GNAT family N-acetyltransferase [Flavobacteriales bacterium]
MRQIRSKVLKHPKVVRTIIRNAPTLDPLAVLLNSDLYYLEDEGAIISFVTLKKMGPVCELGTVHTDVRFRGKGLASSLIRSVLNANGGVYVLCAERLKGFYEQLGFSICTDGHWAVNARRRLFNVFLRPLTGYTLVSLRSS